MGATRADHGREGDDIIVAMIAMVIVLGTTLGVTLVSLVLHEIMHGLVAHWLGDDTAKQEGRLTLNPAPHIDPYLTIVLPALAILATASGTPMPVSATSIVTTPCSSRPRTSTTPPGGVYLAALDTTL